MEDTEENGHFSFTGLGVGFYKIVEVDTPGGYVKISEDPTFEVRTGAAGQLEVVFTDTDLVKYTKENGFRFGNEPGAALPSTGGPGTGRLTFFGILLTGLACVSLVLRRRPLR